MSESGEIRVLFVGTVPEVESMVLSAMPMARPKSLNSSDELLKLIDSPEIGAYHMMVAGPLLSGISVDEIAQAVRTMARDIPMFYAHTSRENGFDRKTLKKNGFTDAFLLPFDADIFKAALDLALARIKKLTTFRSVRIADIEPGASLDFDVHVLLPRNQKYVHFSSAGCVVDKERVERLKKFQVGSVFVPVNQMNKFYDYTAMRLKTLYENSDGMSVTETRDRLQSAVRDLMSGIFSTEDDNNFATGRKMLEDAGHIVKSYIAHGTKADLVGHLMKAVADVAGSYSHLSNVSTFASLFSMATGIGKPEDLALAGLFHDLGLSMLPPHIQAKEYKDMTPEEREVYARHPEHSVNLVKQKKIVLPEIVQTMIMQHHERYDGSGFPEGVREPALRKESQLLAIADEFDELTRVQIGKAHLKPVEALQKMRNDPAFNPILLDTLLSVFGEAA